MSRNYKFHNPDGLYFVSFAVIEWIEVFKQESYIDILLDGLVYCQKKKGMEIVAWCVMTNHMHLIFRTTGLYEPQKVLGEFKQFTSRMLVEAIRTNPRESRKEWMVDQFKRAAAKSSNVKNYQFWRHDNKPIELWSNKVIDQKINYVHQNPVKKGWVQKPEDYPYSSAKDYAGEKGLVDDVIVVRKWSY